MICDGNGAAVAAVLSEGQRHDGPLFHEVYEVARCAAPASRRALPAKLAADKAYRAKHILERLEADGVEPVIPPKVNEKPRAGGRVFDAETYRGRNIVERLFGWLKHWRGIATRYDKLARNYYATLLVALIERSLRGGAK